MKALFDFWRVLRLPHRLALNRIRLTLHTLSAAASWCAHPGGWLNGVKIP
jgi:hypothetical protein